MSKIKILKVLLSLLLVVIILIMVYPHENFSKNSISWYLLNITQDNDFDFIEKTPTYESSDINYRYTEVDGLKPKTVLKTFSTHLSKKLLIENYTNYFKKQSCHPKNGGYNRCDISLQCKNKRNVYVCFDVQPNKLFITIYSEN